MNVIAYLPPPAVHAPVIDIPRLDEHGQAIWRGDSMAPTIEPGDVITVDLGIRAFSADGIYAIGFDDWGGKGFILRRLISRPLGGGIDIICDNPAYEKQLATRAEVNRMNILGRVVESWTRRSHA